MADPVPTFEPLQLEGNPFQPVHLDAAPLVLEGLGVPPELLEAALTGGAAYASHRVALDQFQRELIRRWFGPRSPVNPNAKTARD